ncbi:MAG: hypothetical protein HZB68_04450 [Candidatus Aenigmarchaeota archaeon]|nr:hypothetical protein [Candidatus Aenigmarchaeota archaeon]
MRLVLFFLLLTATASAVTIDIQAPQKIKYGSSGSIALGCLGAANYYAKILLSGNAVYTFPNSSSNVTYTVPSSLNTGDYDVTGTCESSNETVSASKQMSIYRRDISLISRSPQSVYADSNITFNVDLQEVTSTTKKITANDMTSDKWKVYVDNAVVPSDAIYQNGRWEITIHGITEGTRNVKVSATMNEEMSVETTLSTVPVMSLAITSLQDLKSGSNATLTASLMYRGSSISLKNAQVFLTLDGSSAEIMEIGDSSIIFRAPGGSSNALLLRVIYSGLESRAERTAYYTFRFSGKVENADGKASSARISFVGANAMTIDTGGSYDTPVKGGRYNMVVEGLSGIGKATFKGVNINGDFDNAIKYDSFTPSMESITSAGAIALEFSKPFDSVEMEQSYDSSKVDDESKLRVYACHSWNLAARKCNTAWEETPAAIDSVRDLASFSVTSLSAFVIGYPSEMYIEGKPQKEDYNPGEDVVINGLVKNSQGKGVEGANIQYSLGSTSGSTTSGKDGIFSLSVRAPKTDGSHSIIISLKKSGFKDVQETRPFKVTLRKELGLFFDLGYRVNSESLRNISFSVSNTGDANIHSIKLKLVGLPEGSVYIPQMIASLQAGERKDVSISLPKSSGTFSVTVTAEADETSKSDSFAIIYENKTSVSLPSGFIPSLPGNDVLASLGASILAIAGIEKMRSRKPRKRSDAINVLKSIDQEIKRDFLQSSLQCSCGKTFTTKRALGIHRSKSHKS